MVKASCLAGVVLAASIVGATGAEYQLGCPTTPFATSTVRQAIDNVCGNAGDSAAGSAKGKQNLVKNNLCSSGDPRTLSLSDFMSLQSQAAAMHVPFGADGFGADRVVHLPEDRAPLSSGQFRVNGQPIREGDLVRTVAFIDDPHAADLGGDPPGEDVNCHQPDAAGNDIHINLVETPAPPKPLRTDSAEVKKQKREARNAALCKAIVAEMIPHFRPDAFDPVFLAAIAKQKLPVRISGQLFFDASHRPCNNDGPQDSSVRGSLWEIHPIYTLDVCKHGSLQQCPADDEGVWTSLQDWATMNAASASTMRAEMELEDDEDRKGEHEGE
jgi:hypothetical protein